MVYGIYISASKEGAYRPDFLTELVAKQTVALLEGVGYSASLVVLPEEPNQVLAINDTPMVKIIEGCNAVSIMILFVSFITAFYQKWKKTLLFLLAGLALIYTINLVRIALLSIALKEYPSYEHFLHSVLFPAIIYGMVFLLWIIWVRTLKPTAHV